MTVRRILLVWTAAGIIGQAGSTARSKMSRLAFLGRHFSRIQRRGRRSHTNKMLCSLGFAGLGLGITAHALSKESESDEAPKSVKANGAPLPLFRFGVIADVQYADIENGQSFGGGEYRFYRGTLEGLAQAVDWWNKSSPPISFIAQLGDLIDGQNAGKYGEGLKFKYPKTDEAFKDVMCHFKRSTCQTIHHAIGNHELYNFDREELHQHLFSDKTGSDGLQVQSDRLYYSFRPHKGWRFIMLDSYDIALEGRSKSSSEYQEAYALLAANNPNVVQGSRNWFHEIPPERQRFVPYNGGVGKAQLEWLKNELRDAKASRERAVVMSHVPLNPRASSMKTVIWNYPEVLKVIHDSDCVALVLAGHHHPGGYTEDEKGCHHVTVHGSLTHPNTFGIIDVYSDRIQLTGKGDLPDMKMLISQ